MAAESIILADGNVELMFLQQQGADPFTGTPSREAQIIEVANRLASFIAEARETLDIAIYDFRLHDQAASIIAKALKARAQAGVIVRIAYDALSEPPPNTNAIPSSAPAILEADKKPPGTESFVQSLGSFAQLKGITGYRVLMHSKYIVRDAASDRGALMTGSANFTNDSWGLQENNLLSVRSQPLALQYAQDFSKLWSRGKIVEANGNREMGAAIFIAGVRVSAGFTPLESAAIVKEIVGAIAGARERLLVASVVISSGPVLAALSEALDRGVHLQGLYDGPQMDEVERQWKEAHVGAEKLNTWRKVAGALRRKNSLPYDRFKPHNPHNFMHNKLVLADDLVVTGSFNLSNHALSNAENVLFLRHTDVAAKYDAYLRQLIELYAFDKHAPLA
jgi:phosphatidylserine/phosphatidylglycerophosphate/cardiolipin synthase-like enzyme